MSQVCTIGQWTGRWNICCLHVHGAQWGIAFWLFWNPHALRKVRTNIQQLDAKHEQGLKTEKYIYFWKVNFKSYNTMLQQVERKMSHGGLVWKHASSGAMCVLGLKCTKYYIRAGTAVIQSTDCRAIKTHPATYFLCDPGQIHKVFCTSVLSSKNSTLSISMCLFQVLNHQINFGIIDSY